jgi:1-acyl-sn-glycerol-3-phosphate acyltransferase
MLKQALGKTHKAIKLVPYWVPMVPIWLFFRIACLGCIEGHDNIKGLKEKGFVIASNHVSYLDWLILHIYFLFVHHIKITFFAKDKVLNHPVWGKVVTGGNCIHVNHKGVLNNNDTRRLIKSKYFAIFPEGTRSPTGKLLRGKTGVAKLALQTGLPIIPCGLIGFYNCWPRQRKLPRIRRLKVVFGKPYYPQANELNPETLKEETSRIMLQIAQLTEQPYNYGR